MPQAPRAGGATPRAQQHNEFRRHARRSEHGMVAEEHVLQGQPLVQVPSRVMMTWDSARGSALCGQLVKDVELTEWQVRRPAGPLASSPGPLPAARPQPPALPFRLDPMHQLATSTWTGSTSSGHDVSRHHHSCADRQRAAPCRRRSRCTCCARERRGRRASGRPTCRCCPPRSTCSTPSSWRSSWAPGCRARPC
jgi:hypothetical protein